MKKIFALTTRADKLLIAVLIIFTALSYAWAKRQRVEGSHVIITVDNKITARYPLNHERESITLFGAAGEVRLQIKEGRVKVIAADCPNKICVGLGWKGKAGDLIVCVPNRMLIKVVGSSVAEGLDGVSR
jgi:hypothetical protein